MNGFEIVDPRFDRLVLASAPLEKLADGFRWTEGPVWFGDLRLLLFSDIANDRVMRWSERGGVEVFREPSNFENGHTRDREGRLISCSHGDRCVHRTEYDGRIVALADRYRGKRLNSPNDVVVKSDGSVWFTDPLYGIQTDYEGGRRQSELPPAVYRLDPRSGALEVVADDFGGPNGLCFSPDESRLYIAETGDALAADPERHVRVFDVAADGASLAGGRVFHKIEPGNGDGFRCDEYGNPVEQCRRRRALHRSVGRPAGQDPGAPDGREPDLRRAEPEPALRLRLAIAVRDLSQLPGRAIPVTRARTGPPNNFTPRPKPHSPRSGVPDNRGWYTPPIFPTDLSKV
jgi:gluconolactonase